MVLGSTPVTTEMDPTAIITALKSILSAGMVEPAVVVASTPSLAASKVTASDERGGGDKGTICRRGPSPLDSALERPEPLEDPRRQDGEAPQRSKSPDP
jgi:hypothetical protein